MHADVIVIGLGAAGSHAAWTLAQKGAGVLGLEAEELIHTRAAYSGESRLFRAAYHEGAEYVPLLLESRAAWVALEESSDRAIFHDTGVLSIGAAGAPQMAQVQESLARADLAHEVLDTEQLLARYPQHSQITDEIGVLDLLGGVLRPESAVSDLQRRAATAGAELRDRSRVDAVREEHGRVVVELESGEQHSASRVVVAAGVHTPRLVPSLAAHLEIRPIVLTWFCPERPGDFAPEVFPAFIRDHGDIHLFGVPSLDGSLVKTGYDARFGTIAGPEALPRALDAQQRARIGGDVHRFLEGLPPHIARESMHMDIYTADKRPVLGPVSERIIVGTGYSGHGFKLSPAFGSALARFALGEAQQHDLSAFDPERFAA